MESDELNIEIHQGRDLDLATAGANVVIDVLRAFTTTHVAFEKECPEVLLAETIEDAFRLSEAHPEYVLAGERDGRRVEGFDLGNSPARLRCANLQGRGLVLTTTNGVRATMCALDADHVLVTGWSNVRATLRFLRRQRDQLSLPRVQLVASHPTSDEDLACAEFLAESLRTEGSPPSPADVKDRVRSASSAQKFYGSEFLLRDLDIACRERSEPYVMAVDVEGGDTPKIVPRSSNPLG